MVFKGTNRKRERDSQIFRLYKLLIIIIITNGSQILSLVSELLKLGQNPEPPNHLNQPNYSSQGNYPRQPIDTTARQGPTPVFCHQAAPQQNLNNSNNGIVNILRRRKRKVLIVIFVVLIVVILIPNVIRFVKHNDYEDDDWDWDD